MTQDNFSERYDRFQRKAVTAICDDFAEKQNGRFLLVIPTGGGKTFTAVKSVNAMYEMGILNPTKDRVLWTAHRGELISQAQETFVKYEKRFTDKPSFQSNVDFRMIGSVTGTILNDPATKLVVIDEAHHGAANSYLSIFERPKLGVLGLTATPTRHDGKPLEFERESFSVGFPDLVEIGVVLRPEVRRVEGGTYNIALLTGENNGLEVLNNTQRNQKIISAIHANYDEYKKIIIYLGTKKHVRDLYQDLRSSILNDQYESISYVMGDGNSRSQSRKEYFDQEQKYKRSIIVNVDILTEGYDDSSINTVVMARPTSSKLVYMQSMGRAIRHDPNDDLKKAYIVEVVDDLPNIRYRIDNRWLYSDISDALEPAVIDREYSSPANFNEILRSVYLEYGVPENKQAIPEYHEHFRYTLLLFRVYTGGTGKYLHIPILIDNQNRSNVSNMFNFLSERMQTYRLKKVNKEQVFRMINLTGIPGMETESTRSLVFESMENASNEDEFFNDGRPWITFVTFRLCQDERIIPDTILQFIENFINRDEILAQLKTKSYLPGSVLIRYPLPLSSFVGKIVPDYEFQLIEEVVNRINDIKHQFGHSDHRPQLDDVLRYSLLPVEPIYSQSIVQIVREKIEYFIALN